jgi:bifunctional non-homologous end joining protein LigD
MDRVDARVSNPDKVIFPDAGLTKRDLVGYYEDVGPAMLPHIAGRPLTLERYPNGIGAKGFMQKNASKHFPEYIHRVEVPRRDGSTTHPVVTSVAGITYLANQGTVTFHVPTVRIEQLFVPDRFIVDLDPAEGDTESARLATEVTGAFLAEYGLASIPMTTGGDGYHTVVPIEPGLGTSAVGEIAQAAAALLEYRHPGLLTTHFRKERRKGRVFVDWLRNRAGQTGVAPWSLRARPGAPAAVPITWDELEDTAPDGWSLATAPAQPQPDPLLALAATPSDLRAAGEAILTEAAARGVELAAFDRFRS